MKTMSPFEQKAVAMPHPNEISSLAQKTGQTYEQVLEQAKVTMAVPMFVNNHYTVLKRFADGVLGPLWHLSIRRNDNKEIRSWDDMQEIKNALCGPECEGVELYPAESRRQTDDKQYHMWVFMTPGKIMPLGVAKKVE